MFPLYIAQFVLVAFFVFLALFVILQPRKPKAYPPGPLSLPIIGNLLQIGTHPFIKFMEMAKIYGDIFSIDFGSLRGVIINNPTLIREALNMAEFSGRPKLRILLEMGEGKFQGVMLNEGPVWVEHRRWTLRSLRDFGFGKRPMESFIQEEIDILLSILQNYGSQPFETTYLFNIPFANSLWCMILGERLDHNDPEMRKIAETFHSVSNVPVTGAVFFFPWLTKIAPGLTGYNETLAMHYASVALFKKFFLEHKRTFKLGQPRHFVDAYLEKVMETTDPTSSFYGEEGEKNLVKTVLDLFVAGIETTSTLFQWTFMLMSVYPEIQEKFFQEIKSVVGLSRPLTLDDEKNLPYTQALLTEIQRFSSLVPFGIFHSTTEDVEFQGYKIPKETVIVPNLYSIHHNPVIWGDPEVFRPERFISPEGTYQRRADQPVLVFSTGKRVCLGETLARSSFFLFMTNIFQKFKVEANPAKPPPKIEYTPSFVLHPKAYEYVVTPRSTAME